LHAAEPNTKLRQDELVKIIRAAVTDERGITAKVNAIKETASLTQPSPELIEALLDNLWFRQSQTGAKVAINPMSWEKFSVFPAYDALVAIGKPVEPHIVLRLQAETKIESRKDFALLLMTLAGKRSRQLLEDAVTKSTDPSAKSRLREALILLDKRSP
jgi:hypothetical protein